jgi:Holliday junction resolvase RusA-like endonuclease
MQVLKWEGRAVSCNQRLASGRTRWKNGDDYRAFRDAMTIVFKTQWQRTYTAPDVLIHTEIGPRMDHHNLGKPILDALQAAGVIDNDKHIGWLTFSPPDRHKNGEPDKLIIFIRGI